MNKEKEIETVTLMVRRYCRGVHGTRGEALCPACNALLEYARQRRDKITFIMLIWCIFVCFAILSCGNFVIFTC